MDKALHCASMTEAPSAEPQSCRADSQPDVVSLTYNLSTRQQGGGGGMRARDVGDNSKTRDPVSGKVEDGN